METKRIRGRDVIYEFPCGERLYISYNSGVNGITRKGQRPSKVYAFKDTISTEWFVHNIAVSLNMDSSVIIVGKDGLIDVKIN